MKKGYLLVISTAFISGLSIYLNKFSVSVINPYVFTTLKNVVVAVFLLSLILVFRKWEEIKKLTKKDALKLIAIGLIGGAIPFLLFFKGLSMTSAAKGGFIHKTMFLSVAILAVVFLKEKINKKLFLGILALLAGTLLLVKLTPSALNKGDLLVFLAVLLWSFEQIVSKHVLKKLSGLTVAWGRIFFGSIFLLIFLGLTGQLNGLSHLTASQISWTLLTAVLLIGYVITYYTGLKKLPVSVAACLLALGAPITVLLSLIFDRKIISLFEISGLLLISLGVFLVTDLFTYLRSLKGKIYVRPGS
ncbi:MAG: DMT family transporter [Patescibacteria group bacterium]